VSEAARKRVSISLILIVLFIAYFLGAARGLDKEPGMKPVWVSRIAGQADAALPVSATGLRPFQAEGGAGYFSADGGLAARLPLSPGIAVGAEAWAERDEKTGLIRFNSPTGAKLFEVASGGYPYLAAGRFFAIQAENDGITEFDRSGKPLWTRDIPSLITAIAATPEVLGIGGLDGELQFIGRDGKALYRFSPGGSRIPAVYGLAFSKDSSMAAAVCGARAQRFILFGRKGQGYKIAFHKQVESDFRRPVMVEFSSDSRYVLFEREGGLSILDVAKRKLSAIPLSGKATGLGLDRPGGPYIIAGASVEGSTLSVFDLPGFERISASFGGRRVFMDQDGMSVFLASGPSLARIDMTEE
jgi:hypothetical protein